MIRLCFCLCGCEESHKHVLCDTDLDEQLEVEAMQEQECASIQMPSIKSSEEFPSVLPDSVLPPPESEWPEVPPEDIISAAE